MFWLGDYLMVEVAPANEAERWLFDGKGRILSLSGCNSSVRRGHLSLFDLSEQPKTAKVQALLCCCVGVSVWVLFIIG